MASLEIPQSGRVTLAEYAPLSRFVVLIVIWATDAFSFKLFMDLSIRGLVLAALFYIACIAVAVGFKTRVAMGVLALTLIAHGVLLHHKMSLAMGGLAALSDLLPLGAYYSLDYYFAARPIVTPYQPVAGERLLWSNTFKFPVAVIVLAIMIGGPVWNQVLHHRSRYTITWDMFNLIGHDFVSAEFFTIENGQRKPVDYMAALGHKLTRPEVRRANKKLAKDLRIVKKERFDVLVARLCAAVPNPAALRVQARIASPQRGWETLYTGNEALCKVTHAEAAQ